MLPELPSYNAAEVKQLEKSPTYTVGTNEGALLTSPFFEKELSLL